MEDPKWLFEDEKNVVTITTKNIMEKVNAILYVSHDEEDGMWQFHDGYDVSKEDGWIVSLEEIVDIDNTVMELHDLPLGWIAWRDNKDSAWNRRLDI